MQSEENKDIDLAKSVDNVISTKINQILENQENMEKSENPLKGEVVETTTKNTSEPPESWRKEAVTAEDAVVSKNPELITPVQAETFRKLDRIESDIETLMKAVLELTKSHDGLCENIQTTVIESMAAPKKAKKRKEELYTEEQEAMYKKILTYFTDKTGKTQRDLTNGTNQMVAAVHDYTLGQPGDSNSADFILAKVSKDHAVDNTKYLSVDQYLDIVKEYVMFITKDKEVVFD